MLSGILEWDRIPDLHALSTRLPAAFSDAFGFKPTFGRVPGYPSAHTGTLFHVVPLTRTVSDAASLLEIIAQPDPRDWHALPHQPIDWHGILNGGARGLRIAFSPALGYADVDPEIASAVASAVKLLAENGAVVEEVDPGIEDAFPVRRARCSALLRRALPTMTWRRKRRMPSPSSRPLWPKRW